MSSIETILLLVEDDASVRTLTAAVLGEHFCVLQACNAAEALRVASSQEKIDFLLTDVEMGAGLNGIELGSRMAAERPGIRVLVMSGHIDAESNAARKGFPFLAKPFTPTSLRQRVREVLGRYNSSASWNPAVAPQKLKDKMVEGRSAVVFGKAVGPPEPTGRTARIATDLNHDAVAVLAYTLWHKRGCPIGSDREDWFQAEDKLRKTVAGGA